MSTGVGELSTGIGELFRLRSGVHRATTESGRVHLIHWPRLESLGVLPDVQRAALDRLSDGRFGLDELRAEGSGHEVDALVDRLRSGGWLRVTVTTADGPSHTLEPVGVPDRKSGGEPPSPARLSPYAVLTPNAGELVLAVPGADCDVRLHDPRAVAVVSRLAQGAEPGELAGDLELDVVGRLLADLAHAGVLDGEPDGGSGAAADELRSRQWSPHELWFHAHSRLSGRRTLGEDIGKTGRFDGVADPLPPLREPAGPSIALHRPDLDALRAEDPPLTAVLEDRASVRTYDDDHPLTLRQLGEFLYRCTSTREKVTPDGVEFLGRPYPSGGASYELELYPLVHRVDGLDPGLYRYDQGGHRLERVDADPAALRRISGVNQTLQDMSEPPQVLLLLTARFGRTMWKYEAFAYALILKHVGILFQVMYLVATAMELSACAVGTGDSEEFAAATGLDPLTEGTVGEFMLGSRPAPERNAQ